MSNPKGQNILYYIMGSLSNPKGIKPRDCNPNPKGHKSRDCNQENKIKRLYYIMLSCLIPKLQSRDCIISWDYHVNPKGQNKTKRLYYIMGLSCLIPKVTMNQEIVLYHGLSCLSKVKIKSSIILFNPLSIKSSYYVILWDHHIYNPNGHNIIKTLCHS